MVSAKVGEETPSVSKASDKKKTSAKAEKLDYSALTRAQLKAVEILTQFGVFEGIALKQLVPTIGGSELEGFEDLFVQKAILYFQKNASKQAVSEMSAQTFVVWWHNKKVFDAASTSGVWGILVEELADEKKKMQKKDPQAYENRLIARTMTNDAFESWYRQNK